MASVFYRAKRRGLTAVLAVFFVAVFFVISVNANPNCFVENKNNWQMCQVTCMEACRTSKSNVRSILGICERLAGMANRKDDPSCRRLLAETAPPPPPPPDPKTSGVGPPDPSQPTLDVCLKKAGARPGLLDKLNQQVTGAALRDTLNKLLANPTPPSSCAPAPAALRLMYDCIGDEANQIQNGFRSLQERLGNPKSPNRCDRPISEYDQAYQILDGLKQRADNISTYSEKTLLPCSIEWQDWMDAKSKATDLASTSPSVFTTLTEIISGLREDLQRVAATRSKADETIKEIKNSLDRVQASVISALLLCDR